MKAELFLYGLRVRINRWQCWAFGHSFRALTLKGGINKVYCARCGQWRA